MKLTQKFLYDKKSNYNKLDKKTLIYLNKKFNNIDILSIYLIKENNCVYILCKNNNYTFHYILDSNKILTLDRKNKIISLLKSI